MASAGLKFGAADFIICALTVAFSVSIGIYYAVRRHQRTSILQYFIGNRKLGAIPVAMSLAVSYMSSGVMVGLPAEVYHFGIPLYLHASTVIIGTSLSSWICAPLWYQLDITSSYQYLDLRFKSRLVRMAGAGLGILQNMVYSGAVLIGPGAAVEAVTGFPSWATICILGFASILYTTIGGFTAVIWTDVFQLLVMTLGLIAICVKTLIDLGSLQEFWDNAVAGKRIRMLQFNPDPTIRTSFWSALIGGTTFWFVMAFSQQGVQRIVSMKNLTQAKRVLPYSVPVFLVLLTMALFEGLAAYGYYAKKGCDPFVAGFISDVNGIMPYFVMELCRNLPGLPGLFMASIFSASLSTVSSCLNSISAVALSDFVQPFWSTMTDRTSMWVAKALVVVFGVLSLGVSFLTSGLGGPVTQIIIVFIGAVVGPNSGVFLLGAFFPWANSKGVLAGVVSGLGITFWIAFSAFSVKIPHLPPAPSDRCWLNVSYTAINSSEALDFSTSMSNLTLTDTATADFPVYTDLPYAGSGISKLYAISYMLYPTLGLLITVLVGLVVSLVTGRTDPADVNPMCISHLIRHRFYKPKPTENRLDLLLPVQVGEIIPKNPNS